MGPKKHATSRDKKITQPLGTKKIMQPFGTKTTQATCWDKKIKQPSGTQKSCNLLRQKNHATSQNKTKNYTNFCDKKDHATFGMKKIMKPIRKKKNHATSQEKKSCNLLGQKNQATS